MSQIDIDGTMANSPADLGLSLCSYFDPMDTRLDRIPARGSALLGSQKGTQGKERATQSLRSCGGKAIISCTGRASDLAGRRGIRYPLRESKGKNIAETVESIAKYISLLFRFLSKGRRAEGSGFSSMQAAL